MTDQANPSETSARAEAVQAVVDRVAAWQHGAPERTVLEELTSGFDEVGVDVDGDVTKKLADAIESDEGPVDASAFL